jgi:hypothetical protein
MCVRSNWFRLFVRFDLRSPFPFAEPSDSDVQQKTVARRRYSGGELLGDLERGAKRHEAPDEGAVELVINNGELHNECMNDTCFMQRAASGMLEFKGLNK